jgi:hypothetical protein
MTRLFFILGLFTQLRVAQAQSSDETERVHKNRVTVNMFGLTNGARFTLFTDNVRKKVRDKFKIWQYTTEGDPIITKVKFNGRKVVIKTNNRRDKFAGTKDRLFIHKRKLTVEEAMKLNTLQDLLEF